MSSVEHAPGGGYKPLSFGDFVRSCAEHGAVLQADILVNVRRSREAQAGRQPQTPFDPHGMLSAIRVVARTAQRGGPTLVGEPVPAEAFAGDFLGSLLGEVANSGAGIRSSVVTEARALPQAPPAKSGSCAVWEGFFARGATKFSREPGRVDYGQVIVDGDEAVALRMSLPDGDCAGLTLRWFEIGGVAVPPGSMVDFNCSGDRYKRGRPVVSAQSPRAVSLDAVDRAGLMRPAAFALPTEQRLVHWTYEHPTAAAVALDGIAIQAQTGLNSL